MPQHRSSRDEEHLKLLSVFHYVWGGLCLVGLLFLFGHYKIFSVVAELPAGKSSSPKGFSAVFDMMKWIYLVGAIACICGAVFNFMAARFIKQRRGRIFCFVIAALNCLQVPLGTGLGVFTFIVLSRDSVRRLYEAQESGV